MTAEETHPIQFFRVPASSSSTQPQKHGIRAVMDPHSQELVIRWSDVLDFWPRARCAMNGTTLESFLYDEEHKPLSPRLIRYRAGTILDLVMNDDLSFSIPSRSPSPLALDGHSCFSSTMSSRLSPPVHRHSFSGSRSSSPQSLPIDLAAAPSWAIFDSQDVRVSPELLSRIPKMVKDMVKAEMAGLLSLYSQALMENQMQEAHKIKALLMEQLEKNGAFQSQIIEMTEAMTAMQEQIRDKLVNMNTQIQAVLTQNFELHEYTIPRLFIVLPKDIRRRNAGLRLFSRQFRLYFLCECESHTTGDETRAANEVHLAKHQGYDINRPKLFFKKYGKYALAMLNMIKFGVVAAGIVVPSLAQFKIAETLSSVSDQLDFTEEMCGELVDESTSFIEGQLTRTENTDYHGNNPPLEPLNRVDAMEGVELRQLRHFLNKSDKAGTLGDLYRTVTSEGRVKWVCQDHFHPNYRESSQRAFVENVKDNAGVFDKSRGSVQIILMSKSQAKEFYSALENARGIHELDVSLNWECTMDDYRTLSSALGNSAVVSLKIRCSAGNPRAEIVNSRRRHTPLIQLLANNRLQSVTFEFAPSVLSRVDLSAIPESALHLRHLSLDIETIMPQSSETTLSRILNCCRALQTLCLRFSKTCEYNDLLALVRTAMKESRALRDLTLVCLDWKKLSTLEQSVAHFSRDNEAAFRTLYLEDFIDVAQATLKLDNDGVFIPSAQLKPIAFQEFQHCFSEAAKSEQRKLFLRLEGHHLDSLAVANEKYVFPGMLLDVLSAIEDHQGQSLLTSVFIRTSVVTLSALDSLLKIIQQSPRLSVLKVEFSGEAMSRVSQNVLLQLGPFATEVTLSSDLSWLRGLRRRVDRSLLPKMAHLRLSTVDAWDTPFDLSLLQDLISLPAAVSSSSLFPGGHSVAITSLSELEIHGFEFGENYEWVQLLLTLDFSTLEYLIICGSVFTHDDFGALLNVIPFPNPSNQGTIRIALRGLAIVGRVADDPDEEMESWRQQLRDKAPEVDFFTRHEVMGSEARFGPLAFGCFDVDVGWSD